MLGGSGHPIRDEVHARLRSAILDVTLAPGSPLPENELADALRVSRTPIREALQRLAMEALIYVVPQVGTFVARMDLDRVREALFVREAIECAALAVLPSLGKSHIQALGRIVTAHRQALRADDLTRLFAADEAFHRTLLELAGMPGVWRFVREAREMHRRVRVLARTEYGSARRSVQQHDMVVGHLAARRVAEATDVLREHIRMNAAAAESLARTHPHYFVSGENR